MFHAGSNATNYAAMFVLAGYLVEKCEIGSDFWQPVPGYCPNTTYTVRNLEEGKQYKFRVRAENIYGISEPLEGKPVTAKNPFGKIVVPVSEL